MLKKCLLVIGFLLVTGCSNFQTVDVRQPPYENVGTVIETQYIPASSILVPDVRASQCVYTDADVLCQEIILKARVMNQAARYMVTIRNCNDNVMTLHTTAEKFKTLRRGDMFYYTTYFNLCPKEIFTIRS